MLGTVALTAISAGIVVGTFAATAAELKLSAYLVFGGMIALP